MLGNVMGNAAKWARRRVAVSVWREAQRLNIRVEDDGPGFRDTQSILRLHVRANEQVSCHGVGPAVVNDLVASHEGELRLSRSDLGGARLDIVLPAACPTLRRFRVRSSMAAQDAIHANSRSHRESFHLHKIRRSSRTRNCGSRRDLRRASAKRRLLLCRLAGCARLRRAGAGLCAAAARVRSTAPDLRPTAARVRTAA